MFLYSYRRTVLLNIASFYSPHGASSGRTWFISKSYGGCANDYGWLMVKDYGTTSGCSEWDSHTSPTTPYIMYAPGSGDMKWSKYLGTVHLTWRRGAMVFWKCKFYGNISFSGMGRKIFWEHFAWKKYIGANRFSTAPQRGEKEDSEQNPYPPPPLKFNQKLYFICMYI